MTQPSTAEMPAESGSRGRIPKDILDWSLQSIELHGDNDLFLMPIEFAVFRRNWSELGPELTELRVDLYRWSEPRKLLLSKDRLSFRQASQLDPLDSLILTALVKLIAARVEVRRQPRDVVFSSRLAVDGDSLYDTKLGWEQFWRGSRQRLEESGLFVARSDIADFYGQVRHDEILAQFKLCGVPERLYRAFAGFLDAFGKGQGRGVPIGPHAAHLLAELSLIRLDELLKARNIRFNRYIDDFHIFCADAVEAQTALYDIADVLQSEFGLTLNRMKTSITEKDDFIAEAKERGREETPSQREEELLDAIRSATSGDYEFASFSEVFEKNPHAVADETIAELLKEQFGGGNIDYPKLGWLLRRLAQVGAPGGISYVLDHFEDFVPVIGDAARYLAKAGSNWHGEWPDIGEKTLQHAGHPISEKNAYVQSVLLGLFSEQKELNHIGRLLSLFPKVAAPSRREIILAARTAGANDWLHSLRTQVDGFDAWSRRAYLYAAGVLPHPQQEEALRAIRSDAQGADKIMLGSLLTEHTQTGGDGIYEPAGGAWQALKIQVPTDRREFVEERLDSLGDALQRKVRAGVGSDALLIATWNLRNFGGGAFGFSERLPESLLSIARVLLAYDLIAIQEVRDRKNIERLLTLLGPAWNHVVGGEAPGLEGNSEMAAFLYRSGRVSFLGEVEQVVLANKELILGKYQFARPPFIANFRAGTSTLTLCTAHTYYGAASGAKLARRIAEISALAKLIVRRADKEDSTAILLGDLNVVGPKDPTMEPLSRNQIRLAERYLQPTNVQRDKFYSQITFKPTQQGPRLRTAGVFPVFDNVFRSIDIQRYRSDMERTDAWDTGRRKRGEASLENFYLKWRTYQISDHLPVWAQFGL